MNRIVIGPKTIGGCCLVLTALNAGVSLAQTSPGEPLAPPPAPPASPYGLDPPPPPDQSGEVNTERQLQLAEQKDSKRGLQFVLLHADVGAQWASLDAVHDSGLLNESLDADGIGLAVGGGLGLRFLYLTAGARLRYAMLQSYNLWSVGLEGNLRIPRGAFEPYVLVGAGFAQALSFQRNRGSQDEAELAADVVDAASASGVNVRLGGGFDYFVTPVFSAGVRLDGELLILSRAGLAEAAEDSLYAQDGSSLGLAVSGLAALGLHF